MDFGKLAKFQTKKDYHSMKAHVLMKKSVKLPRANCTFETNEGSYKIIY